jgi:hypothetical protein
MLHYGKFMIHVLMSKYTLFTVGLRRRKFEIIKRFKSYETEHV